VALKRVLIVDDEEDLTWSISKHLSKDKDKYDLAAVNSATAALDVLSQVPVELVVSDIRMPEMSGLDLLMEIRKNYPETKVIIMTAYGSSEIQQEANERGCFKYIEKPFELHELRQLVLDGIEDKIGFEGKVSDMLLSDLVQFNCLGRLTNALHVQKDNYHGAIFFEEGNIVHAYVEDVEGEEAFFEILSWEGGGFSIDRDTKAEKETILKGWQTLMLEALKRVDEIRGPKSQEFEAESQKKRRQLESVLHNFLQTKGVQAVAVFDVEGFPTASRVSDKFRKQYKFSEISPLISRLQKQAEKAAIELAMSDPVGLIIEFEDGLLYISQVLLKSAFLVVISGKDTNLGLLRMESKKLVKTVTGVL